MAISNTGYRDANAYYGGRYNPMNIYGQGRQNSEVISMYNPQAESQFLQATAAAQERFDKASLAASQSLATIGGLDTYDAPELQKRLKSTQDKINKLVQDKYSGDYGAASNEIVNIIGAERAHPFYKFNKQKLEANKAFEEQKQKLGANFMSTSNPRDISFKDWQSGKSFDYTAINRADIVNNSAAMFKSIANELRSNPEFRSTTNGKFLERVLQYGFKDTAEARRYLTEDPIGRNMVKDLKASMPALAELDQDAVMDAIMQGSYAGIGQSRFETRVDPDYLNPAQQLNYQIALDKLKGGTGNNIIPATGLVKLQEKLADTQMAADMKSKLFTDIFAKGVSGITSYEDIKAKYNKAKRHEKRSGGVPISVSPGVSIGERVKGVQLTEEEKNVISAYETIEQKFNELVSDPESHDYALQTFNLTPLAAYTGKGQREIKELVTTLNTEIGNILDSEKVQGVGSKSKGILKDYNINSRITNITAVDTEEGPKYILNLTAENKAKERKELQIEINDKDINKLVSRNLLGISKEMGGTSFSQFYNYYWPAK